MVVGVDQRPTGLDRRAQHRVQIDGVRTDLDEAARDPRHLQQIVDEAHEVLEETFHHLYRADTARVGQVAELEQLQAGLHGCKRIAQLVAEGGQEFVFPLIGEAQRVLGADAFLQVPANLVLAIARTQGGLNRADQRRHANRPLEQRDVSQRPQRAVDVSGVGAWTCQHQDRQVGPRRLLPDHLGKRVRSARGDELFGNQNRCRTCLDFGDQVVQRVADLARYSGRDQQCLRDDRVFFRRGKNQHAPIVIDLGVLLDDRRPFGHYRSDPS